MGYNARDYIRIRSEFENKYKIAHQIADSRRSEVHALIPEVFEIDRRLSRTGMDIMAVITSGVKDTDAEIAKLEQRNDALIKRRGECLRAYGFPEDYTDVHYECEKCSDSGYVDTHMCECMKRALVLAGFESSGLGGLIGKQTFDNFDYKYYSAESGAQSMMRSTVTALREFADGFDGNKKSNFLLIGGTGLGKTHLSTAVAQRVIERGYDVLYVSAVSMIRDFEENRFGSNSGSLPANDVSRYYTCDLLIIDDLGTEVVNKFTQSCLYEVVNTRINNGRCTIINTNLTPTELNSVYTERIASRLLGEYMPFRFTGMDIRKQKSLM